MKITFVQPYYHNVWEALGVGNIITACNFQGIQSNFFQSKFDSDEEIIKGVAGSDYVAFSCTSPTFAHAVRLSKQIPAKAIFGGWHPTALGEKCEVDGQVVVGEGELAVIDIVNGNRSPVVYGKPAPFVWPDRKAIRNERTIDLCESMIGKRVASFQATKGCPFNCLFCGEKAMSHRNVRIRDVHDTLDEIEHVVDEYDLDMFKFADPTFDVSAKRVIDFCNAKIDRGIDTEWECMVHASTATKEMLGWMKEANCNQINIGCESGSPRILKDIRKGATVEKIAQVFGWAKKAGLKRRAFFLVGMPNEDLTDIRKTEAMIKKIKPDEYGVTLLCPYPGCDLYEHETMKDTEWDKTDEYANDFWETPQFSNEELKELQAKLIDGGKITERQRGLQKGS